VRPVYLPAVAGAFHVFNADISSGRTLFILAMFA
jgi:hypothetical protein